MRGELLNTRSLFNVPMLVITHDPDDVAVLAETLIILEQGRVGQAVDMKSLPYRDGEGRVNDRAVRALLTRETAVNGQVPRPSIRAVK